MSFGKDKLVRKTVTDASLILRSAPPVDLGAAVMRDRATVIIADEVIVAGKVETAGFPLSVFCRVLHFEPGASIHTDGKTGLPGFEPGMRVEPAHAPGTAGASGMDGGVGADGGALVIHAHAIGGQIDLSAAGGAGGRPQDGGNGYIGASAVPGADVVIKNGTGDRSPANAQPAGRGGAAGLPGRRARGGRGGDITVCHHSVERHGDATLSALPGPSSAPAEPGAPGAGGVGAAGGRIALLSCYKDDVPGRGHWLSASAGLDMLHNEADIAEGTRRYLASQQVSLSMASSRPLETCSHEELTALTAFAYIVPQGGATICEEHGQESGAAVGGGEPGPVDQAAIRQRQSEVWDQASGAFVPDDTASNAGRIVHATFDWDAFIAGIDSTFVDLYLLAVEDAFRMQGQAADAALRDRIAFLLALCQRGVDATWRNEYLGRCCAMARKLALGLDFFGYSPNRVPLQSFDWHQQLLTRTVLPAAQHIESTFLDYWDAWESSEGARAVLKTALAAAEEGERGIAQLYAVDLDETRKALQLIAPLDGKVAAAYQLLLNAETALNRAIAAMNQAKGCNLVAVLMSVAPIVAGVASGGASLIATGAAASKLFEHLGQTDGSWTQLWDSRHVIGEDLSEIGKGASGVAESIEAIRKATAGESREKLPSLPKFVMEREKFDEVARTYVELKEAAPYREAGYDYLACVEARNQAIVDYNAMLTQLVELKAKAANAVRVREGIHSAIAGKYDPSEPYVMGLVSRLYMDSLDLAARLVHAEHKALAYLYGETAPAPVSALNMATIQGAHLRAVTQLAHYTSEFRPLRMLAGGRLTLELQALVSELAWQAFKTTGKISFTIRRDHPRYHASFSRPGLRITGMQIAQTGARVAAGQKEIAWHLAHGGTERIYREDGRMVVFSHHVTPLTLHTPLDGGEPVTKPDFSEDKLYAGVSPFATWFLFAKDIPALRLDLSRLSSLRLELWGYYVEG